MRQSLCQEALWEYYLTGIQVGGVFHGIGVIAIVPLFDDGVQQFCKYLRQTQKLRT